MLPDATYDVFVVDAEALGSGDVLRLDLTILAGDHKGDMVSMRSDELGVDELDALGLPGTLVVTDGQPSVTLVGPASELLLYAFGRKDHALVKITGGAEDIEGFSSTPLAV